MAYLELFADLGSSQASAAGSSRRLRFSALEQEVIDLSKLDGINTVVRPSTLTRAWRAITGARIAPPLADRRLEALRRFAVLARLDKRRRLGPAISEAQEVGFSEWQLAEVRAAVGGRS